MGRPKLPPEQRGETLHLKIPAPLYDAICRRALTLDVSLHRVTVAALVHVFGGQKTLSSSSIR
jgi:hypothetical protein